MQYYCPTCGYKMKALFCECDEVSSLNLYSECGGSKIRCGECGLFLNPVATKRILEAYRLQAEADHNTFVVTV